MKANLASPAFTGTPLAPTAISGTNTTQLATTEFVQTRIGEIIDSSPAALDTLNELAAALGDDANFSTTITTSLSEKAPLESPTFTGTVSGITKAMVDLGNVDNTSDNDKPVSTAQQAELDLKANLASPTFTGTVNAPTVTSETNNTQIATTAYVTAAISSGGGGVDLTQDISVNSLTIGKGSGDILTNTVIGLGTLRNNTTGDNNTAIGYKVLEYNTTGISNTANGFQALRNNTTGNFNTATGSQALYSSTTGIFNTATGSQALFSNTTGSYNIAIGFRALNMNTIGSNNTAVGYQALNVNTIGSNNSATGYQALMNNTTGYENSATGFQALLYNTTGYYNSAFGLKALRANTTGYRNSAFGTTALQDNTTGYYNTAIGFGTLLYNTTGDNNTAIGYKALYNNTVNNNTATGFSALEYNTTGNSNTANGYQALLNNTTGYYNLAVGYQVLQNNTTGNSNVGLGGYRTLQNNTTGVHNIGIGLNTLRQGTTGDHNIGIGYSAGWNLYAGSNNNILLGNNAIFGGSTTVYNNSTAIGYGSRITASDQLVLGTTDTNVYVPYRMGIGVETPTKAAVEIDNYIPHFPGNGYARFTRTGVYYNYQVSTQRWLSIYAANGIAGENFLAFSDRRIKNNIVDVPDNLALQQVRDIPCRYYEYIDKMNKGNVNVVGFIAQEVKEVLPSAIQLVKRYIPDEYRILEGVSWEEIADTSGNITYKMSSDLTDVSGIKYKFMVGNDLSENEIEEKIVGNADNTFTFDASYQNVFCFGKEVDDFHIIDKNQIFALHHSAIQEIDRLQLEEKEKVVVLETKNTALETKVTELETKNTALETKNAELQTQIDNIMTILNNNNLS